MENIQEKLETEQFTVQVKLNQKKHTCPLCCLEVFDIPPAHLEGEFSGNSLFGQGSIHATKVAHCNTCGLKVAH